MAKQSYLDKAMATLGALDFDELIKLRWAISDLLELMTDPDRAAQNDSSDDAGDEKPAARGHIEAKLINGYGPYLYLRRWEGKTLTSTYIGKARS